MSKKKVLYTVPEVAEMLSMGTTKVWEHVMSGRLPSVKDGRSRRITRQAVDWFVETLEESSE